MLRSKLLLLSAAAALLVAGADGRALTAAKTAHQDPAHAPTHKAAEHAGTGNKAGTSAHGASTHGTSAHGNSAHGTSADGNSAHAPSSGSILVSEGSAGSAANNHDHGSKHAASNQHQHGAAKHAATGQHGGHKHAANKGTALNVDGAASHHGNAEAEDTTWYSGLAPFSLAVCGVAAGIVAILLLAVVGRSRKSKNASRPAAVQMGGWVKKETGWVKSETDLPGMVTRDGGSLL